MTRLALSLATCLLLSIADAVLACPVEPTALVEPGLSSISAPLQLAIYGGADAGFCRAVLVLAVSELPSRRLVPRPRELAPDLVPVAEVYGAKTCEIVVLVQDDLASEADRDAADDACRRGEYRYQGDSWSELGADQPCW
jgi:hypothetical protein